MPARPGAGRPEGARSFITRKRADLYARDGGTLPIDVMMGAMRRLWDDAIFDPPRKDGKRKIRKPAFYDVAKMKEAHEVAKDVAPYIHPKLAAIETTGANGGPLELLVKRAATSLQGLSQEEFDTLMALMQKLGMVSGAQLAAADPLTR